MSRCRGGVWGTEKLIGKLKGFIAKVKAYFDGLTTNTKAEAALLKEMRDGGLHYLERIVEAYDKAATAAVESYRGVETRSEDKAQRDQLAIREAFAGEIDQWAKDGKPEGVRFTLGSTGPVLQGLGAIESDIYMEGDKISTILREHPEMTLAEIKKIPQILEDPALVLKSKNRGGTSNTRLVLLDTAKAKNGRNIVAVLDLRPVEKGFAIDDIQKVSSAYTKTATENRTAKENSRDFLKTSDVLFLDKKRATSLLKTMGFYMPIELHRNGYVGSISYFKQNVNINGVPFSSVVREGDVQLAIRDSEGRRLTEAQQDYFKDSKVRDAEGRLKVVYHGSGAVFTKFSADFMSQNGSAEGQGFYFTDYKPMAEGYSKKGGQLLEGYLDMKNPLSDSEVTLTYAEVRKLIKAIDPTGDDLVLNYDSKGGMGYPSREWYNRSVEDTLRATMSTSDSDSEILAELANGMGDPGAVLKAAREVLGYDGYIVEGKYDNATVYVAFDSSQFKNVDNQSPTADPDIRYSIREIKGEDGTDYGKGVYLDSTLLEGLTDAERKEMMRERVKELGGQTITAYDPNGEAVDIRIAAPSEKFRNRNGRKVPVTKDLSTKRNGTKVKQESVVLSDELIATSRYKDRAKAKYPHGWLDNNGKNDWQYWTTYIQDKNNTVWKATLNVAESANGVKYLYDIDPIEKVGQSVKSDTSTTSVGQSVKSDTSTTSVGQSVKSDTSTTVDIVAQNQTESQAQIRSSTLSDRDVLRIAAQMAKNSESRSLTDADRSAPLNFGYHEAKHLIQSCFIQIEAVSVLQCVLPCFLFRISIFNHQRHRTGKYTNSEERSICGNEKFFPAKINRTVFCREGSFHFG